VFALVFALVLVLVTMRMVVVVVLGRSLLGTWHGYLFEC